MRVRYLVRAATVHLAAARGRLDPAPATCQTAIVEAGPPRRVVIDTNVLVSALLKAGSVPERALLVLLEHAVVLLDARLADEYARVLGRPKFAAVDSARRDALLARILAQGERLAEVPGYPGPLDDPDDRAFVEVALAGRADALVTGNARHFPDGLGFEVLPPAAVLERFPRGG